MKRCLAFVLILAFATVSAFAQAEITDDAQTPSELTAEDTADDTNELTDGTETPSDVATGGTERPARTGSRIEFSGGVDMEVVPFQMITSDTLEHSGNVWIGTGVGDEGIGTWLSVSGNHEGRFGFVTDVRLLFSNDWDPGTNPSILDVELGREGNLWVRPVEWLCLYIGRIANGSQTGMVGRYWLSQWTVGMLGAGSIFTPFASPNIGFLAAATVPKVDGLSVHLFVPSFGMPVTGAYEEFRWLPSGLLTPGGESIHSGDGDSEHRALRVIQRARLAVGYEINENVFARVQYVGANPSGNINWMTGQGAGSVHVEPYRYRVSTSAPGIEAAVAYRIPKRLVLDFGARTWMPVSDWVTDTWNQDPLNPGYIRGGHPGSFWRGIGFGFGAMISVVEDVFSVNFRADGDLLGKWTGPYNDVQSITNPVRLSFHLWPSYKLANEMRITASVGMNYVGRNSVVMTSGEDPNAGLPEWDRSNRLRLGGGASLSIPVFANSDISVGVAYRHGTADVRGGEPRVITVPVSFSYNF